ncbi:MAG TPA: hypothetical protein VMG10_23200 [Gemmataceae bacterium]|nr:hypothetical protein [Gemmataceae bacterium]
MATDLDRAASTPASKYDAFVAGQLARARSRIRLLDLTAGLLGFAALCLAYVVGMVLCDSKLLLSPHTRQLALYGFLAGGAVYLFFAVLRPLWLRVNPYYAARQVEQQLPHAKNSIVNWVDLHSQPLPPAIRGALGQRAAKDLSRVDLDRAISGRRAAWMGGLTGLFVFAFIASFLLLGPSPFASLLKRTFNPFGGGGVSTRTQLTILKPEGGNAVVTVGRGIRFVVEVNGKVPDPKSPDAVKLLYRYEESDPWLERLLMQEASREWTTLLSAIEVRNGFWYRITGGDAVTEEYRVSVRAAPALTDFLATYRFRPYVARADEVRRERELKELRGTEVLLRVRTNRTLREGRLSFEGKSGVRIVPGTVDPRDPHTLLVRFVLDEDGKYRLFFSSTENEAYSDAIAYPVTAIPDKPPTVELTKPGKDIRLPADAILHLEGKAGDDIGVKSLVLRMRVVGGDKLRGQPFRGDNALRLADGGYPCEVEYKDFVELSRVQRQDGKAAALRGGMELEYWLEARDACDYPGANVVESKHYRVLLTEPEKNEAKRRQEKQQADKDKKQHEQKQDQKLQQESQERQQQRQEQEARNQQEENKSQDANKGADGEQSQKKEGEQGDNGESKDNNGQQGEAKNGSGEQNGQQKSELSKEDQKIEEQIKQALERKEASEDKKGEAKPDKGDQGEAKGKGQPQAGGGPSPNDGKGDNQAGPMPGDRSDPKDGSPMTQKGGEAGEGKPGGDPQAGKDAGQGKPQPMGQGESSPAGDSKPASGQGQQAEQKAAGEAKDNGGTPHRGEAKDEGGQKADGKAEAKQGGSSPQGEQSAAGDAKPSAGQGASEPMTKSEAKPDAGDQARQATAKDIENLARALEGKDAREREEAKRQLQRINKQAADAETREKAGEALEKMGEPDGPADGGSPRPNAGSSPEPGSERKDGNDSKGRGSSGSEEGDKGTGAGQKNGEGGNKEQGSSGKSASPGSQGSQGGGRTGGGGERRSGDDDAGGRGDTSPPNGKPAKPRDHRAAQMQLEDFAKKVNKDILKDAGVSEQAWKKYLETRRKNLTPREKSRPEAPSDPRQAVTLPSMGGRTIQPAASGQGDVHGPDRGQPPPGYRDSFREFTRQMSQKRK